MMMENSPMSATEALDTYFIDNRARLLDIVSFLDRIDRYRDSAEAKDDFRYRAFMEALRIAVDEQEERTRKVQLVFSDHSTEPIESALGLKAYGASEESLNEGH